MPFTESASDFIDTDEFADAATINGATVNGILNREYAEVNGIESEVWTFQCSASDAVNVRHGANVTIGSDTYVVANKQAKDNGLMVLLVLEET